MHEAVSDILTERAQTVDGMSRMLMLSLAAHGVLIVSMIVAPSFWSGETPERETPMMISLGGTAGPDAGGRTSISERPVQRVAEPDAKPERPAPPAAKVPEMVAPDPVAKPTPRTPAKPIEKPRESSTAKKPTTGEEIKTGAARVETGGAQIPFGGLSTGGGGGGAVRTDVLNFCCPEYLTRVLDVIRRNWDRQQGITGRNTLKFVIHRDGRITNITVDESGGALLDIASRRALANTQKVFPLPPEYADATLPIYLTFEYTR